MRNGPPPLTVHLRAASTERLEIQSAGEGVTALLGYSRQVLVRESVPLSALVLPGDIETLRRLARGGGEAVLRMRGADGRVRLVVAGATAAEDPSAAVHLTLRDAKGLHRRSAIHPAAALQSWMEGVDEGVFFKDCRHVITAANRHFRLLFSAEGAAPRDVVGLTDYDLYPEEMAAESYRLEKEVLAGAPEVHMVQKAVDRDGAVEWLDVRRFPVQDKDGSITGLCGIVSRITQGVLSEGVLRASEESLKEAERLAGLGSYVLDVATGLWTGSKGLEELFGIGADYPHTVEGWFALVHPADRAKLQGYMERETLRSTVDFSREYRIVRRTDGAVRWVQGLGSLEKNARGDPVALRGTVQDITERKQAQASLQESRDLLALFIEHAPASLAMFDRDMRYLAMSRRWVEDYQLEGEELIGRRHYDTMPEIPEPWREMHRRAMAGEIVKPGDASLRRKDKLMWVRRELRPWFTGTGEIGGIIILGQDVTRQKEAEERLHLAASVFTHASEGIMITDAHGAILDVNQAFTHITGYTREEVLGRNPRFLNSGRQNREFYADMWTRLKAEGHWSGEIWNRAKSGQIYAEMLTISAVPGADGQTEQYVALFSDITSIKEQEQQLERIAHYDLLTGLPNRVLLADRLHQAMAQAHRSGRCVAIACLDLDNFRAVNDRHGHNTGDLLLTEITRRMTAVLREGDTLARLGGDELVAVLLDLAGIDECRPLIDGLLRAAAERFELGELTLALSASIGVTLYPQSGDDVDADQLLRQADQAMYHAKLSGKGRYHVFDPTLDRHLRGHQEDLERIRRALAAGEFELYFQPRVNMRTGTVQSAEALIRWQHPEQGLLAPAQFLPILADHPLIVELGEWVLETALRQMEQWCAEGLEISTSVNIDALHLQHPEFVDKLVKLLARHPGISPSQLELEVLESGALHDVAQVSQVIRACTRLGVSFALDDFGTGYSSLSYLKRLPVHFLKIDQTFVHDMLDDPEDLTILEGVLGLANAFRREAVAEGVETVEHGLMLLRLGCELAQGYGIARPMPGRDVPRWTAHWRPDPRWAAASPIGPANRSLLYASVEHRAWVVAVQDFLEGRLTGTPSMDAHLCRLGAWLDSEAAAGRGGRPGFQAIDASHERLHACANSVLAHAEEGRAADARAGLADLRALRDELLEKLQLFVQSF